MKGLLACYNSKLEVFRNTIPLDESGPVSMAFTSSDTDGQLQYAILNKALKL